MPEYRRNRAPGGTFFFTATLQGHHSDLPETRIYRGRDTASRVRALAVRDTVILERTGDCKEVHG